MVSRSIPRVAVWTGCRVSRWRARRRLSDVVETEVQTVGQESSEAGVSESADCAFCVGLRWSGSLSMAGCSIREDRFREMLWCVQCGTFTCFRCWARSALEALAQRDVEENTDRWSNSCGSCESRSPELGPRPALVGKGGWGDWAPTSSD